MRRIKFLVYSYRVADGAAVVGGHVRHVLQGAADVLHAAQLVGRLFRGDLVDAEATLGVVQQAEVLLGLVDGDDLVSR